MTDNEQIAQAIANQVQPLGVYTLSETKRIDLSGVLIGFGLAMLLGLIVAVGWLGLTVQRHTEAIGVHNANFQRLGVMLNQNGQTPPAVSEPLPNDPE